MGEAGTIIQQTVHVHRHTLTATLTTDTLTPLHPHYLTVSLLYYAHPHSLTPSNTHQRVGGVQRQPVQQRGAHLPQYRLHNIHHSLALTHFIQTQTDSEN